MFNWASYKLNIMPTKNPSFVKPEVPETDHRLFL